ncbi:hypothetical protein B0H67DRAFT_154548 [Lasiosphaeris hirsuta]|uniref:Uncharacterized protein n=1 Tax=Lasiosphaeris hirsuta TaxID=260670 RepID=A0AA40APC4_9PEZI|nr:hypothetical protein B0H67DRAFT_154548 [Lasiosphaeris hirsuta]
MDVIMSCCPRYIVYRTYLTSMDPIISASSYPVLHGERRKGEPELPGSESQPQDPVDAVSSKVIGTARYASPGPPGAQRTVRTTGCSPSQRPPRGAPLRKGGGGGVGACWSGFTVLSFPSMKWERPFPLQPCQPRVLRISTHCGFLAARSHSAIVVASDWQPLGPCLLEMRASRQPRFLHSVVPLFHTAATRRPLDESLTTFLFGALHLLHLCICSREPCAFAPCRCFAVLHQHHLLRRHLR